MGDRWVDLDLVFPTSTGRLIDGKNRRDHEERRPGPLDADEPRHSCVSLLSAVRVPIEEVADLVGHSDTTMTMTVYRHPVKPSVSADVDTMTRLAGGEEGTG